MWSNIKLCGAREKTTGHERGKDQRRKSWSVTKVSGIITISLIM